MSTETSNLQPESSREERLRERMVREQLAARGVNDPRVLRAFRTVPRSRFCPASTPLEEAYADHPLGIGQGQTISQPYIVALMTESLQLEQGNERVLEIGTGSGYQAAILSRLAGEVHSVERLPSLAHSAEAVLKELGYSNVCVHTGDGTLGWPEAAPYDAILVTAAAPEIPSALQEQLADGGILLAPVGGRGVQRMLKLRRRGKKIERSQGESCVFVPLIGECGWQEY